MKTTTYHLYTVKLMSRIADRNCTFDTIPAMSARDAKLSCLAMMAVPKVWLVVSAKREKV